jgi:hypothetical protein
LRVDEPEEWEKGIDPGDTSPIQEERSIYRVEEEGEVSRKGRILWVWRRWRAISWESYRRR